MWHPGMNSNMNFPSLLAFPGLAAAMIGTILAAAVIVILLLARQKKAAHLIAAITLGGAVIYAALLFGCSIVSHEKVLARGQEKYFCEMDCHLAYSVVGVKQEPAAAGTRYVVTLRTRFDETTISKHRPTGAPLMPSHREIRLVDSQGRTYAPESSTGVSLMQPLIPGQSYTTELSFTIPGSAQELKLLVRTTSGFLDRLLIGDENSWFHQKTYLRI